MAQKQIRRQPTKREPETEQVDELPAKDVDAEALKAKLDDLLDEVDEILTAENVEQLANYKQSGGE